MRALFAYEVVKKALKKGKNNIFYIYLGHIDETYSKKIISIINNIDGDSTKICFYELCISAKIIRNLSTKPMSEVTTKLGRVYIDL